jgi:polyhydroxyalkanoate synthase
MKDTAAFAKILQDVQEQAIPLYTEFFQSFNVEKNVLDPLNIQDSYRQFFEKIMDDPESFAQMQYTYWQDFADLWQKNAEDYFKSVKTPEQDQGKKADKGKTEDRRFRNETWDNNALFSFIKQSYMLTSEWLLDVVETTEGLSDEERKKVSFYMQQFINAMAPSNFALTNPDVIEETLKTNGQNLLNGLENLIEDLKRGQGQLQISTTDYEAFEVGKNIATTKGSVVFQNDLIQLIQYHPQTKDVSKEPLLIVPPWINRYYILDLRPENSFVDYFVKQGHSVFIISWVNPDKSFAEADFETYMDQGLLAAVDFIKELTKQSEINVTGYCVGGTLLSMTLAYFAKTKKKCPIKSACFLTTLIDFEKAGDLRLFIDEEQLKHLDDLMNEKGYLEASYLRQTFSLLRSNDMIWSFVVNNYLMGREPFPFDILYWNDDSTNMPAAMHRFYLYELYKNNKLCQKDVLSLKGKKLDIRQIETPSYFLSTKEDHISPWLGTYDGAKLFKNARFTLAASGHVAGVVNPPAKNKYCFWRHDVIEDDAQLWLEKAKKHDGSWWPDYDKWLKSQSEGTVAARKIKDPIEDAPGAYATMKTPH